MMPTLFDTHSHVNHHQFDRDREEVLARAREAGVREMVLIGCDVPSSRKAIELANPEAGLYAAAGIHPHDAETWNSATEGELRRMLREPGIVALGEIGLDFYRDLCPREAQYAAFQAQLELAMEFSLPIVVHTRESVTPSLDVLEPFARRGLRGIMHCWSGTVAEARRARELGFLLGIGGVLTYKKPGDLVEVASEAPWEALVVETDCPYLPPVPHRGQRNEPAFVRFVAEKLGQIKGTTPEAAAAATRNSALALFGLG